MVAILGDGTSGTLCTMLKTIFFRDAEPHEALVLSNLAMRSKAYWGYSAEFMRACGEELSTSPEKIGSSKFYYVVAENRSEIVGFLALERLSDTVFELEALFVEPKHIGTGVGKELMSYAKYQAAALGARRLTIQGDPNAEDFYRAAGGKLTGKRESASIPGRFLPTFAISLTSEDCKKSSD